MSKEFVTEIVVMPDGMRLDDPELHHFALYVRWMGVPQLNGSGGYAVTQAYREAQLSRAGNWNYYVQPFQRRLYRWKTAQEAVNMAKSVVNDMRISGRSFADVKALRLAREGETA